MNLRHHGNWQIVGRLAVTRPGAVPVDVYECPLCLALIREPMDHAGWHKWTRTEHPYSQEAAR